MIDGIFLIAGALTYIVYANADIGFTELVVYLLLFAYAGIGFFAEKPTKILRSYKLLFLLLIIQLTVVNGTLEQMTMRSHGEPHEFVHDHILQIEESASFLRDGKNPYEQNFRGTTLEPWWPENPAMTHVIALPFTILKSVPFQWIGETFFQWYDDRVTHLILFYLAIAALYLLFKKQEFKYYAIIAFAYNPLFTGFFMEGRSDSIFLSLILLALACIRYKYVQAALLLMALAITSKHTAWFVVPFMGMYLWRTGYFTTKNILPRLLPSVILAAIITLPFLLWNPVAFIDDIYRYPAGTLPTSYHINGYGLSMMLKNNGILMTPAIHTLLSVLLLPWLGWLMVYVRKKPTLGKVMIAYGSFLWPFLFVSRFMNDNYLGVIIFICIVGVLLVQEENLEVQKAPVKKAIKRKR